MDKKRAILIILILGMGLTLTLTLKLIAYGASVIGSKHDLSSTTTPEICVFCHTPHKGDNVGPLWNRKITTVTFTMYTSTTMDTAHPGQPNNISLLCLGCHDGVNSADNNKHDLLNAPGPGGVPDTSSYPNCDRCHPDLFSGGDPIQWMGTDLSTEHPISMPYPTPVQDPDFNTPPDSSRGWPGDDVKLYSGNVECASCHNVHDPAVVPFLRKSNSGSALCLTCHTK